MAQKDGELKKRCRLAKQRLKMGYWDSVRRETAQVETAATLPGSVAASERIMRIKRSAVIQSPPSASDEKMYKKVCDILDSDEIALNPIGQLIERDVYDGMDAPAKQRYILELSEKFRELKDRYYRERTAT